MTEKINEFWELTREDSVDGERIRRRIAAMGAVCFVACGFLLVIGLGLLVVAFFAGVLLSALIVALLALLPRVGSVARSAGSVARGAGSVARSAGSVARSTATGVGSRARAARVAAVPVLRRARGTSSAAVASARTHGTKLAGTT